MLRNLFIAGLAFPALVIIWALMDGLYRRFSMKRPELGPPGEMGGCGVCAASGGKTSCHFPQK